MKLNSGNLNINLRHLRAVHAIWTGGSFARAASELGVVPSALTETVRQVEVALGAALFDRSLRPPQPTPFGLEFLRDTRALMDEFDLAIQRSRMRAGLEIGTLAIGAAPSAITGLVGPALARFRTAHPAIRCLLHDDIAERLAELVVDGTLDLAIAGRARESGDLKHRLLSRDRFGLACSAAHPLALRSEVALREIDPDEIISLDMNTGTQQLLNESRNVPSALCDGPVRAHSTVAQLCMIRAGLGLGLMPEGAFGLFGDPSIRFVPLTDLELWRSLYLIEPARRPQSHIAQALIFEIEAGLAIVSVD